MPTYRNDSGKRLVVAGQTVEPGQKIETNVYHYIDGLTKISNTPYYNPVVSSGRLTVLENAEEAIIEIPESLSESFSVDVYVSSGEIELRVNDIDSIPMILSAGSGYSEKCMSRVVDKLYIKAVSDAKVEYNILKF